MADSSIIEIAKNKVIEEFIKNPEIVQAIDSRVVDPKTPEKLIGTHIFDYGHNPRTLNDVDTFITVQVHIPDTYFRSKPYVKPQIEIWVISHERHMKVDNVPKIRVNRNDYISRLISNMFNGRLDFGIGKMVCIVNIEGVSQQCYVWRKLVFEATDTNVSMCKYE